ncbi:DNA primase [Deferribacter thermophilus]|uniref:DNA primase n=1 Tax=Deferribacter thermophilus TaxID=53573 RepID=UPI003C19E07B
MRISEDSVSVLLENINIVDLVSEYVELKKTGKNHRGLCPFHSEKTPSFYVSEEKGVFHCFGCGASGNSISFVMKYFGYDFLDAVSFLSEKYGITININSVATKSSFNLYELHHELMIFSKSNLLIKKKENISLKSFLDKRMLSEELIDEFDIGFIDDNNKLKEILKKYSREDIISSGLFYEKDGEYNFKLSERLLFPIRNLRGKVVGFSGRSIDDRMPKYINSPENPIFSKRRILFNLDKAKDFLSDDIRVLFVVEGYMDVIRMWQNGIKNVVSPMGTALTEDHVNLLKRYSDEVILLFDGDDAGKNAAFRTLDIFLKVSFVPNVVFMKKGEDPDSFLIKYGRDKFLDLMESKHNLLDLIIKLMVKKSRDNLNLKNKYLRNLQNKISIINDEFLKDECINKISKAFNVDSEILKKGVDFSLAKKILKRSDSKIKYICEYDFIAALFSLPEDVVDNLIHDMKDDFFFDERMRKIFQKIVEFLNKNANIQLLVDDSEVGELLSEILLKDEYDDNYYKALVNKYKIHLNYLKKLKKDKQNMLKSANTAEEKTNLIKEINQLIKRQKEFEKRLLEVQSI